MLNDVKHRSHSTVFSYDSSMYDEKCIYCGATDELHNWGKLKEPCPKSPLRQNKQEDKKNDKLD